MEGLVTIRNPLFRLFFSVSIDPFLIFSQLGSLDPIQKIMFRNLIIQFYDF